MYSNRRDIVVGLIVVLTLLLGLYFYNKSKNKDVTLSPSPSPVTIEFQKDLEDSFKYDIPDNVDSFELKDVKGGDARGIATDNEILVDANDPETGYFYQGWLEKDGKLVSLGKMQVAKGGWLLEYDKSKMSDADKIIVSLERKYDSNLEDKVLEGSFK